MLELKIVNLIFFIFLSDFYFLFHSYFSDLGLEVNVTVTNCYTSVTSHSHIEHCKRSWNKITSYSMYYTY